VEFDLSELSNLILSQSFLGSTIKTDGEDSDPFALLTVLNMTEHGQKPVIKALAEYFILKTQDNPDLNRRLRRSFASSSKERVGLILSERLINMPTEVIPPMYKLLSSEIGNAIQNVWFYWLMLAFISVFSKTF
jgi:protein BCP1